MEFQFGSFGRFEADFSSGPLFRRCANCPPSPPPCPTCGDGEVCSLTGGGCDSCPSTQCTKIGSAAASSTPTAVTGGSGSSPAGPIAGGVIGGIVVVCLVTFLLWRFCIRNRLRARRQEQFEEWPDSVPYEKDGGSMRFERDGESMASPRSPRDRPDSVHSARSIASTVLTRASNVIQIAYIPGVTNRSVDSTPDLIPPVPPLPAVSPMYSSSSTLDPQQDQHYFMPSDLRDSTYSDYTVDRTSYARSSLGPSIGRGSVPSTAYRESAVIHTQPAQTAIRGKANAVAVKSNGKNSPVDTPRSQTPPMPIIDRARFAPRQSVIQSNTTSPIIARLGVPKAVTVTKPTSQGNLRAAAAKAPTPPRVAGTPPVQERKPSLTDSRHNGDSSTFDDASSDDDESTADRSLMGHEKLPQFVKTPPRHPNFRSPNSAPDLHHPPNTSSSSSPNPDGHIAKFSQRERKHRHKRSGSLNQIIEEATKKASKEARHGGLGSIGSVQGNWKREIRGPKEGPFDDSNAAATP